MDATEAVMDLAKRRGFLWPAFEVYGGAAGLYDYGPHGAVMKKRLEDLWRHFFLQTCPVPMAEVSCPRVTIEEVLVASGHVGEFSDLVVRCGNGHPSRADHLIEGAGFDGTADALSAAQIDEQVVALKPKCSTCGDKTWTPAAAQNLMFQTEIGPGSGRTGYLRPETAQGIFTDFPQLLRHFRGKLPFGGIQIGGSHRNEISPRQGMLRLREFHMMEAEVFFTDTDAPFPAFADIKAESATFVPNKDEQPVEMTFAAAVESGMVCNEALAYFLALTQRFLITAGMDPARLRFRQHLADEMAHYASDCWDAEFHSDRYGWVECVGIADRGCYDLSQHAKQSGKAEQFSVAVPVEPPVTFEATRFTPVMGALGKEFKAQAKDIATAMEGDWTAALADAGVKGSSPQLTTATDAPEELTLDINGDSIKIPPAGFTAETGTWTVAERREIPSVIEPSFGVDRILYALWEHAYEKTSKNDESYTRMRLSPHVAPVQTAILPLTSDNVMVDAAQKVQDGLRRSGVLTDFDVSGNIGRRYARQDEIGTPVCITIDEQTLEDGTVTLRDRDSTEQVRVPIVQILPELAARFALA